MKAVVISQARMTSERLPGKVMKPVGGQPILKYHTDRVRNAELYMVVATTTNETDDVIVDFCKDHNIDFFRGDEHDVLSRYYFAAREFQADLIVRVTSDCPLIDGELIKNGILTYQAEEIDNLFISNTLKRTYPRGFDFAVFSFSMLEEAFREAKDSYQREHVTPYLRENKSGNIQFRNIAEAQDFSHLRITLDTPDDLSLITKLIEDHNAHNLGYAEIINLFREYPELHEINKHIIQKS